MTKFTLGTLVACLLTISITGCGKDAEQAVVQQNSLTNTVENGAGSAADATEAQTAQWSDSPELIVADGKVDNNRRSTAVLDPNDIPYPLYPNGYRYRIGGEGDLKIVLFQTEDSFEQVDAYFQEEAGMPRLSAMSDYVRYSADKRDIDPWETSRPGIVIHQFNDASEREAVGAANNALTNIIMSFK